MNRWLFLRRARGPAFLILFGVTALLSQWGVLSIWRSWPLYLILAGILMLAERASLAHPPSPTRPNQTDFAGISGAPATPPPSPALPPGSGADEPPAGRWRA